MSYHFGKQLTRQTKVREWIFDLGPRLRVAGVMGSPGGGKKIWELFNIYKIESFWNWILRDVFFVFWFEPYLIYLNIFFQEASSIEKFGHLVFCHPSPEEIDEFIDCNIQLLCGIMSSRSMVTKSESNDLFRRLVALDGVDVAADDALVLKLILSICSSIDSFCRVEHKFKGELLTYF